MPRDELDLMMAAFEAGEMFERHRIAAAHAELEACWRPAGRRSYLDRVRERQAEMENWAAAQPWITWRGRYPGGPVDYETGRLREQIGAAA